MIQQTFKLKYVQHIFYSKMTLKFFGIFFFIFLSNNLILGKNYRYEDSIRTNTASDKEISKVNSFDKNLKNKREQHSQIDTIRTWIASKSSNKEMGATGCAVIYNLREIANKKQTVFSMRDPFNILDFAKLENGQWRPKNMNEIDDIYILNKVSISNDYEPLIYSIELNGKVGTWMDEYPGYYKGIYGVYSKEHWRMGLISIVRYYYNKYKMIPIFHWHPENPYVYTGWRDERYGPFLAARYRYKSPNYPQEHRYVINEILNNTGSQCGMGRYSGEKSQGFTNPRAWFDNNMEELKELFNAFVDSNGNSIPIIFRPLHEMSGDWQWWGTGSVSCADFKSFFKLIVNKLHESNNKNILIAYNPDRNALYSEDQFFKWYPGNDYVDIIACDYYNGFDYNGFAKAISNMSNWAYQKGKIAAILEINAIKNTPWYSKYLYQTIKNTKLSIFAMYSANYMFGDQNYQEFIKDSILNNDLKNILNKGDIIKRINRIDLTQINITNTPR